MKLFEKLCQKVQSLDFRLDISKPNSNFTRHAQINLQTVYQTVKPGIDPKNNVCFSASVSAATLQRGIANKNLFRRAKRSDDSPFDSSCFVRCFPRNSLLSIRPPSLFSLHGNIYFRPEENLIRSNARSRRRILWEGIATQ